MTGFRATTDSKELALDTREIAEAVWVSKDEVKALLAGKRREDLKLPPPFTIAHQLLRDWAED